MKHMIEFLPHIVKIEDTKPHATLAWQGTDSDEVDEETTEEVVLISVNNHPSTSLIGGFQSRKSAQPMRGAYLMKQEPVLTIQVSSGRLESTRVLKDMKRYG